MTPSLLIPIVGMLAFNYFLWKRGANGWRRRVKDFIRVLQPHVDEPIVDVIVLQPAGSVGRQARGEQRRGLNVLFAGLGGEVNRAIAEHRAGEQAEAEDELPPMTALAVGKNRRFLLPVKLEGRAWSAGAVERSWGRGDARYELRGRTLTVQFTIALLDGSWTGEYEFARDPAKYAQSVADRLDADG